jgi:hypothetical protein
LTEGVDAVTQEAGIDDWPATRTAVIRDAVGIGVATGTYGLSFGALSAAAGLSLPQICVLSSLMFTGASQFAMVGVIGAGGNPFAGAATATLLGTRNALYGLHLSSLLRLTGWRRVAAAQLVIDESAAMAVGRQDRPARLGFWTAGLAVFVCWNTATLLGAVAGVGCRRPGGVPRVARTADAQPGTMADRDCRGDGHTACSPRPASGDPGTDGRAGYHRAGAGPGKDSWRPERGRSLSTGRGRPRSWR